MLELLSEMDLLYGHYLQRTDRVIEIDSVKYYRIIRKDILKIRGEQVVLITIPNELYWGKKERPVKFKDENGREYETDFPLHISFRKDYVVPKWYQKTATVPVINVSNIEMVGDYLAKFL